MIYKWDQSIPSLTHFPHSFACEVEILALHKAVSQNEKESSKHQLMWTLRKKFQQDHLAVSGSNTFFVSFLLDRAWTSRALYPQIELISNYDVTL